MDNKFIDNNAMFILLGARRWVKANPQPDPDCKLYCSAWLDRDMLPLDKPWPFFWAEPGDAHEYAKEHWPKHNILLRIDSSKDIHPRRAVKEV